MSGKPLDRQLEAVEAQLQTLHPAPSALNRDRVMFLAGQAAGQRRRRAWLWPCATAAATVAATVLAVAMLVRPQSAPTERIVYVPVERVPEQGVIAEGTPSMPDQDERRDADTRAALAYLRFRQQVVAQGMAAVPEPKPTGATDREKPGASLKYRQLLEQLFKG